MFKTVNDSEQKGLSEWDMVYIYIYTECLQVKSLKNCESSRGVTMELSYSMKSQAAINKIKEFLYVLSWKCICDTAFTTKKKKVVEIYTV